MKKTINNKEHIKKTSGLAPDRTTKATRTPRTIAKEKMNDRKRNT